MTENLGGLTLGCVSRVADRPFDTRFSGQVTGDWETVSGGQYVVFRTAQRQE